MSPEMIRGDTAIGRATDIWSLGCVVVEMITGKATVIRLGGGSNESSPMVMPVQVLGMVLELLACRPNDGKISQYIDD